MCAYNYFLLSFPQNLSVSIGWTNLFSFMSSCMEGYKVCMAEYCSPYIYSYISPVLFLIIEKIIGVDCCS